MSLQANARFDQNGSTITGILSTTCCGGSTGCGFTNVTLQGSLEGTTLRGTIAGEANVFTNGEVDGSFSGTTLELNLRQGSGLGFIPEGSVHLHR